MIDFSIRRLQPGDSIDDLTLLLHRSFAPMGSRGLNCQSVDQTPETTRQRIKRGDCFVAVANRKVVGTITLQAPDPSAPIRCYRAADVASIHQFAVDPDYQGGGIGHALLQVAAIWARTRRYAELALDTPAPLGPLRDYYVRQGFRLIGLVQLMGRTYESAVMAKPLVSLPKTAAIYAWPARRPAELSVIGRSRRLRAPRPARALKRA
jgi:GNAT superfamily N-acetyltransferase